jgi:hypothetical protein
MYDSIGVAPLSLAMILLLIHIDLLAAKILPHFFGVYLLMHNMRLGAISLLEMLDGRLSSLEQLCLLHIF